MKKGRISKIIALALALLMLMSACGSEGSGGKTDPSKKDGKTETETEATTAHVLSSSDKLIALTFDDGPRASTTGKILDILEENNSMATFFVVGYNIESNTEVIKRAKEMGCEIGNHSKNHKNLSKCSVSTIREEVDAPNQMLKNITGSEPVLFRVPGGNFKNIESTIGMPLIQWSIDTEDWRAKDESNKNRTEEQRKQKLNEIAQSVFDQADAGDIVLMHDIYDFTADLCAIVIPGLVQRGFHLVTVSKMYEIYGEKLESGKIYRFIDVSSKVDAAPVEPGSYKIKTSGSVLNMRSEPDMNAPVLEKIPNGTLVEVTKSQPGWAYLTYNSAQGWVNSKYITKVDTVG